MRPSDTELHARFSALLLEFAGKESVWWWLSFADGDRPPGAQFLGVAIVDAPHGILAISRAHELGINPGGEVQFVQMAPEHVPPEGWRLRLLSRGDLADYPGGVCNEAP